MSLESNDQQQQSKNSLAQPIFPQYIELSDRELVNIIGGAAQGVTKDYRVKESSYISLDYVVDSLS